MSKSGQRIDIASHQVMRLLLPLTHAKFVSKDQLLMIPTQLNIKSTEARVFFLNELLNLLRNMPEKIFPSLENRERLLAACLEAADQADNEDLEILVEDEDNTE